MNYIEDIVEAYRIYEELKNIQIGITFNRLIKVTHELKKIVKITFSPNDLDHIFQDLKNSYGICYGNLEMLRSMQIILRTNEKKAIYKVSDLGNYFINQKLDSVGYDFIKIILNLNAIQKLITFIKEKSEVNKKDVSAELGEEMVYYTQILYGKGMKKPYNEPIAKTLLDLLVEIKIIQKSIDSKNYYY